MRQRATVLAFFMLVTIGAASQYARAANLRVNCDKHESLRKALRLLANLNPQGPNTITVSGKCKANFVIQKYGSTDIDYQDSRLDHGSFQRKRGGC